MDVGEALRLAGWGWQKYVLRCRHRRVRVHDFEMWLDLKVPGVSRSLAVHGTREADKTELVRREVEPGMTCVDLGANIGYYALLTAGLVGPAGRVLCVEPDPRNLELLRRNVSLNGLDDRVEVAGVAISDRAGTATMYQATASNLTTLVAPDARSRATALGETLMSVETTTLDAFMAERGGRVNFLRMDIEGYEVDALRGGLKTLAQSPRPCKILLETHPQMYGPHRDFGATMRQLYEIGFRPAALVSAGTRQPEAFAALGYAPREVFHADGYARGYYDQVTADHAIELVTRLPKVVRYLLLRKS
jgi:FkbM family methyltransferase